MFISRPLLRRIGLSARLIPDDPGFEKIVPLVSVIASRVLAFQIL